MSKKKNNEQEPWSRRFGEDENYTNQQYSRSARKTKKKDVAPLSNVLLFVFFAMLIIPFAIYYYDKLTESDPEPKTTDQVMISKQESSESEVVSEENSSDSSSKEPESSEASSVESEESDESQEPVESELPEEPEQPSTPTTPTPPVTTPETDPVYANTYTVQAGDNLYRIAVNHGMTLDELKQANGLTSDVAEIGMVLNVR